MNIRGAFVRSWRRWCERIPERGGGRPAALMSRFVAYRVTVLLARMIAAVAAGASAHG